VRNVFGSKGTSNRNKTVVGDIRQTQLITSFGCGSIIDFVNDTVIIAGTDKWDWTGRTPDNKFIIYNQNLQNLLNKDYFVKPKTDANRKPLYAEKSRDIPAYRFPEMLYCTNCHRLYHYTAFNYQTSKKIKCFCGSTKIVPSRFVAMCEEGHIEDFPYSEWVHGGNKCSKSNNPKFSLFNVGGKSEIGSLFVKCNSCGLSRGMHTVFMENALVNIKKCSANTPWLPRNVDQKCNASLKTRLRNATNVYFPVKMSALSIPPWSDRIYKKLEGYYDVINLNQTVAKQVIENLIQPDFPELSFEDISFAFNKLKESKENKGKKNQCDIYYDEYLVLTRKQSNDIEYSAEFVNIPIKYESIIKKVAAIDRLTEVVAMLGFTRLKSWSGDIYDKKIAPLSLKEKNWLPAVQLNGEGIFIEFDIDKLEKWSHSVTGYYLPMMQKLKQSFLFNERFSPQYVLLHTFAHLLIRQLSIECGYSVASLKEKIYSTFPGNKNDSQMAGVLIYTAAPDSDGSLGGLVEQSDPLKLGYVIDKMLETARWCSSDPLCINSFGENGQGFESLNYAACHSCALLPETSCEFRNLLLDRGALIGRPDSIDLGIFNNI